MSGPFNGASQQFDCEITLKDGKKFVLPVSPAAPIFVVGPNGAGKSGLLLHLYQKNRNNCTRISAHRQMSMESNAVPFSPNDKIQIESNAKEWDANTYSRWREIQPKHRTGIVIANLIEAENAIARRIKDLVAAGDATAADIEAKKLSPLDTINEIFFASGIPIKMRIEQSSAIVASKRGGPEYSIAALSDGERAALLTCGMVLTAPANQLILIDEPERHLHPAIAVPLLIHLVSSRPDCSFLISTHELNLPLFCKNSKVALMRDSEATGDVVQRWDIDLVEEYEDINDEIKIAVIGSRRKILFVEGTPESLDKPLYELLFPGISVFPRNSCRLVEEAVTSLQDSKMIAWIEPFGIVDKDQLTPEKIQLLERKGIFSSDYYSIEALYYHPEIMKAVCQRRSDLLGGCADTLFTTAVDRFFAALTPHKDRLCARASEASVRAKIFSSLPTWKTILTGAQVNINVDPGEYHSVEKTKFSEAMQRRDIIHFLSRYPVRETPALEEISKSLNFTRQEHYELAVRKILLQDERLRHFLVQQFGNLAIRLKA